MLEIQQVNKSFGAQTILTDIDLVIKPGKLFPFSVALVLAKLLY